MEKIAQIEQIGLLYFAFLCSLFNEAITETSYTVFCAEYLDNNEKCWKLYELKW